MKVALDGAQESIQLSGYCPSLLRFHYGNTIKGILTLLMTGGGEHSKCPLCLKGCVCLQEGGVMSGGSRGNSEA